MEANVKYRSGHVCFRIQKDDPGIYTADLLYFEGSRELMPPEKITLIRGIRHWTGSCDDDILLNDLGRTIEDFIARYNMEER